eukprot:2561633-Rhodomonas_salina.1
MPHLGSVHSESKQSELPPLTSTHCIQEMLSSINTSMFIRSFGLAIHNLQLEAEYLVIWIHRQPHSLQGKLRLLGAARRRRAPLRGTTDGRRLVLLGRLLLRQQQRPRKKRQREVERRERQRVRAETHERAAHEQAPHSTAKRRDAPVEDHRQARRDNDIGKHVEPPVAGRVQPRLELPQPGVGGG